MADLTPLIYNLAKEGFIEEGQNLVGIFLKELKANEKHFRPTIYKYAIQALEKIRKGEDAREAFLVKRKGRGNKQTRAKLIESMDRANDVVEEMKNNGGNLDKAAKKLAKNAKVAETSFIKDYRKWVKPTKAAVKVKTS